MPELTTGTQLFGLIGHPLGHSLSPAIHNAALVDAGIDGVYLALPVSAENLKDAIAGVRAWRLPGLSVTIPHKVAVIALLDDLTPEARAVGAVNTLYWDGVKLMGDNTDLAGYRAMLGSDSPRTALVLGAGGGARAIMKVLTSLDVEVRISARRFDSASALAAELGGEVIEDLEEALKTTDLLVNCTPIGMFPNEDASPLSADQMALLPPTAIVHDLVYKPLETRLLGLARGQGLRVVDGGRMLIGQAAAAFARWTGREPPVSVMANAFRLSGGELL